MHRLAEEGLEYETNGAGPVAVAFSADWCSSSRDLAAALEQVGEALGDDRLTIGTADADREPGASARHRIRGLPPTMLFKDGVVLSTRAGGLTGRQLHDSVYDDV